jgi:D-cysteine desulfhydrase
MREESRRARGCEPYVIPFGGTNALSTIGFVNAGFELSGQIRSGAIPAPDVVYVALGSMGTAAGIALGLALGNCTPTIRAVAVTPPSIANRQALCALIDETAELLTQGDEAVPADLCSRIDIEVVDGYLGEEYALFTPEGVEAVGLALAAERLHLEGTYTGKTLAALISDGTSGKLAGKTTLFWNTYNSQDLGAFIGTQEYRKLPEAAWTYFESDLQPLDTGGI